MKRTTLCLCVLALSGLNACKTNRLTTSLPDVIKQTVKDQTQANTHQTQTARHNAYQVQALPAHVQQEIDKAIALTNQIRAEKKLPPLKYNANLAAYAQVRAQELLQTFSHNRPDGQSYSNVLKGRTYAENIAAGSANAAGTIKQWRESTQGHYESMINPNFTTIGIGMVSAPNSKYGYYWVQIFGDDTTTSPYFFAKSVSGFRLPSGQSSFKPEQINQDQADILVVDGKQIALVAPKNQAFDTIADKQIYQGVVSGTHLQNARYGAVQMQQNGAFTLFSQGKATPENDMPTQGKAQYKGHAVLIEQQKMNTYATSQFQVDFGAKTVVGEIVGKVPNIQADIVGNTFQSKSGANTQTQGQFFGAGAAEMSGVFQQNNGTRGVFGASKQ